MQALLNKIEATAGKQLVLPEGRKPGDEIARYKRWLKQESHRLKIEHRGGAGGLTICRARAHVVDLLLKHFWEAAKTNLSAQAQREFPPLALVALGGYGRGELSPQSDIDFMFLHNRSVVASGIAHPYLARMIDGVLYPLWDLGFKVGHSVRNLLDCVNAAGDNQTRTSLIESRLIAGDPNLFARFWTTVLDKCVAGHEEEYVRLRLEDQAVRRSKFGDSACMQEPNIKNGCGGLRDFQNLLWMAFFKYRTRSLEDLQAREFLSAAERKQLEQAYDFLLRVRTEMHYLTNRPTEILAKAIQPAVAANLDFHDRSPSKRIERFMREVYTHTRAIYLNTRTLERRMALVPAPQRRFSLQRWLPRSKAKPAEPVDGFHFVDGEIRAASSRIFRDQPRRLMRAFLHAQQRGLDLHPDLAQMIRNQLSLVDRSFQRDAHVCETFLTILNQRGNVAPTLRAMHEVDFLGKYIPEFGRLTCLVQHEFYHQYSADEHTLMCLEQADRIWEGKGAMHAQYAELFQRLDHPYLLYLALLLHDVGKTDGSRGHAAAGAKVATKVARRLGLEASATQTLEILVAHHLELAATSQRRDLEDPAVIQGFAQAIQSVSNLNLLALLTFADAQATSDKLWNGFKDSLLWTLYNKTLRIMRGGTEFVMAKERQREVLFEAVCKAVPKQISAPEVEAHFEKMSGRYLRLHSAEEIVEDLKLAHRFMRQQVVEGNPLAPVFRTRQDKDSGCSLVTICTWDRGGLFSHIAGCLSAVGLNILTAQIFTRTDGIVFDTFHIVDGVTGTLAKSEALQRFETLLERLLIGKETDLEELVLRQKSARTPYQAYTGDQIQTQVRLDNESSDNRTIIEVETEDRVGLLYILSRTFHQLQLHISAARICTEKGGAIDVFYVREYDGKKLLSQQRQEEVVSKLKRAVEELEQRQ
ncbi:MAG: [protein-PII] uridylyltransferase [Verrucomicrobia bacterium]|nr:[protein-PII] uridylyltransferase [Verrucomicrobiota bacterium]